MTEPNCINFKLHDPNKSYKKVSVAGTFNNWNPTSDELSFDDVSKDWRLELLVELPLEEKVLYKYVVDGENWVCDVTAPFENDSAGNQNNSAYVVVKENSGLASAGSAKGKDDDSDQKSQDDTESHDVTMPTAYETAPTSGEEEPGEKKQLVVDDKKASTLKARKVASKQPIFKNKDETYTFWDSIKWFVKYYILSWFCGKS